MPRQCTTPALVYGCAALANTPVVTTAPPHAYASLPQHTARHALLADVPSLLSELSTLHWLLHRVSPPRHPHSAVPHGGVLAASYGTNTLLVSYPDVVAQQFPDHVARTTVYGRLANKDNVVNIDFQLDHDATVGGRRVCKGVLLGNCAALVALCRWHFFAGCSRSYVYLVYAACLVVVGCGQLGGYIGVFDLRDPGDYTLQVVISAFFGDTEPQNKPVPIVVGTHAIEYTECNTLRSLVSGVSASL